ncbi:MAG: hypothetical protein O2821_13945 [Chloroflexi bacterium]|nr:hypothetical protein [Chloroflexota bacterium]
MVTETQLRGYIANPHQFRREQVILPNGRYYGEVEEHWQRDLWERVDATDAAGAPLHNIIYQELSRGHAKTTTSAIAALTSALLNERTEIFFFAGDADQAAIGLTMLQGMIEANPLLRSSFSIRRDKITVPATGTTIKVMASDGPSAFGIGGTAKRLLVIVDEFWVWKSQLLWEAIISSTGKVSGNYQVLILSNAGIHGESDVAWRVREACKSEDDASMYFWSSDGCVASWVTDAWKAQQRRVLTPGGYTRLIDNLWTAAESQFITGLEWDILVGEDMAPMPDATGSVVYVGVDASKGAKRGSDTTAVAAVRREGEVSRLVGHRIFKPTGNGDIDLRHTVLPYLQTLKAKYDHIRVYYDPYAMVTLAQIGREAGILMTELPQTQGRQTEFTTSLLDAIRSQSLRVYPAPDLREHIVNAVMLETARGVRLAKEKASRKIDGAVALAMAVWGARSHRELRGESRAYTGGAFGPRQIPAHQAASLEALYPSGRIPDYAVDKVPRSNQRRSQSVPMRRINR